MPATSYHFRQTYDTAKQLGEAGFSLSEAEVVAAWGREAESGAWEGGFLLRLRDGSYIYLAGWCGDEGWGVQDGAMVAIYDERPQWRDPGFFKVPRHLAKKMGIPEWDEHPVELNRYVAERGVWLDWYRAALA